MFKNVASQKLTVFAFADAGHASLDAGEPVTGDAAQITCKIEQDDDGTQSASNDTNPTEVEDGQYRFDLTQAETNGDKLTFYPESSTAGVQVIALPSNVIYTRNFPANFADLAITSSTGKVTVGTNDDKTDYSLSSAGIQAIWDALTSALTTASSIGKLLVDNINAAISSRSSHSAADVRTEVDSNSTQLAAIVADTGELQTDWADGGRLDLILDARASQASIGALNDPTAAAIADAVWDEVQSGHTTGGTFGAYLDAAISGVGGAVGSGADAVTITVTRTGGSPVIADADVWVTSDAAGTTVVAGTLQTDGSGQATFMLDDGVTYYLWMQKDGEKSIQGESFVASAD